MTLDITKIAAQIGAMAGQLEAGNLELKAHLDLAVSKLGDRSLDLAALKQKLADAHLPWNVAGLGGSISGRYDPPAAPADYTVVATDGSDIALDRNQAAFCYLINIGAVMLRYGSCPDADMNSLPFLYADDEALVIRDSSNSRRTQQIRGALADNLRSVEECRHLAKMAQDYQANPNVIAMMDGSLVLFGLESYLDFVQSSILAGGLLPPLNQLRTISQTNNLVLVSYISLPGSNDVVNVLRAAICPQSRLSCEESCSAGVAACDVLADINDRLLFDAYLKPAQRSDVFMNLSSIVAGYGPHKVCFYYLKLEDEIARVEIPQWVADRPELLELSHALVLDQCRRGHGYPVALSEAHEQAVVTAADREQFWSLVEQTLTERHLPVRNSVKSRSKRTRWI